MRGQDPKDRPPEAVLIAAPEERSAALDFQETGLTAPVHDLPDRLPRAAVAAWAAGSAAAPYGRRGKKLRRRTRKIAAALAAILVMSSVGGTAAMADPSFYKASPYISNTELVDAGSRAFDPQLAIGEPESTGGNAIAARTLEDAIINGGLSPDDMEMPDMMLAGISGDQMALAAAADDDAAPAGTEQQEAAGGDLAQTEVDAADGTAGKGPPTDATVEDLAKDAAQENPDGFASPALGGDPEPIVDEYAAASSPEEPTSEEQPASEEPAPVGPELASASTDEASDTASVSDGEASGAASATETSEESAPIQSDELAYTPVSDDDGSEGSDDYAPEDSGEEPATSPSPPAEPEDDPDTELASAEEGSSDDTYAYPPTEAAESSGTQSEQTPPEEAPPEEAASDEAPPADLPRPYGFEEEEADDYVQGTLPEHSSASENAPDEPGGAQEEGSEPGPQYQVATVALSYDDQAASEDAPPEIAPEAPPDEPPGQELEQGQGQGQGGGDAPSEEPEADAAGSDQTFSDPEATVEDRPATGEQAQGAGPQEQEGQNPEAGTPPPHGQAGESEPASAPEPAADGDAEGNAGGNAEDGAQEVTAPEEDSGVNRPASQGDNDAPVRPLDDAPAQDRPQRPQQQRDPDVPGDQAPESQQSPPRPEGTPERRPDKPDGADRNTDDRRGAGQRGSDGGDAKGNGHAPRAGGGVVPNRLLISTDRDGHSTIHRQQPGRDELLFEDDVPFGRTKEAARDRLDARPVEPAGERAASNGRGFPPEEAGARPRPEPEALDGPGTQTFGEPEAPSSERGPERAASKDRRAEAAPPQDAAVRDASAPSDEFRASPKDGAERTPPVWDRQGLPEDDRPQDRNPEGRAAARQSAPAGAEQVREARRAERQAELRADRQQELWAERQAELREARQAERIEAREAAQEAAIQEAADRAALRQQRRAERAAESAAKVRGFADQTQPRNPPRAGGGQLWDAPAVEPSLPAPKAHRWAKPQPVEPVIAEQPAYQKPAPVRTSVRAPGAAAGGFDQAPRVAAKPVAAKTSPLPARQAGAGFGDGGFGGNVGGGAVNNPAGNVGSGGAVNPVGGGGGGAAGGSRR